MILLFDVLCNNIIGCGVIVIPINSTSLIPIAVIDSQYSAIITIDDSFKKRRVG